VAVSGVFLSYRKIERSYAPMFADWVLRQRFGAGLVFEAGHENRPGTHFPSSIEAWLDRCSLLVVFIDPPWVADLELLRNPDDWVRKEILHFVEHGKPILPILLDGASMPRGRLLPTELVPMTKWIALSMSTRSAHADMQRLVGRIEEMAPDLVLAALREPVADAASPSALLHAEQEVFPFRPRPELADLADWSLAPDGPPIRLVIGPPGAGKTRLALRLCAELRGADHPAVMLPASATPAALDRLAATTVPFLVVIDDAETRPDVVAAAARALARASTPARVLLLARTSGEWLQRLRDDPDDRIVSVLDRIGTLRLAPQVPEAEDFEIACTALGARLGLSTPPRPAAVQHPATLLEVQAEALVALHQGGAAGGTPWPRIAALERHRWGRAAATFGLSRLRPASLMEIMATVTIFGAATEPEAEALIAALRAFRGAPVAEADAGRALVRTMLPGPLPLNPAGPQPFADEIIAELVRSGYRLTDLLDAVTDGQARTAIIALGRCLVAHPDIGEAVGILLGDAAARLLPLAMTALSAVPEPAALIARMSEALPRVPAADLDRVTDALPQRSEALAGFAVELTRRALAARRAAGHADAATARLSRLLAVRLAAQGGPVAEAVAAARAAVEWSEADVELAEAHAALALALDLDPASADDARQAGARAIELYRAAATDDRTRAALGTALINQAHRSPDDRGELAIEAYEILRPLHEARPNRYRSLYADAADVLAALTRSERLGREALRLRRSLVAARPDAYRPALAAALFNLGLILGAGNETEALWRESETILTELAATNPERFGADLARVRARLAGHDQ
jgi:TIR domain